MAGEQRTLGLRRNRSQMNETPIEMMAKAWDAIDAKMNYVNDGELNPVHIHTYADEMQRGKGQRNGIASQDMLTLTKRNQGIIQAHPSSGKAESAVHEAVERLIMFGDELRKCISDEAAAEAEKERARRIKGIQRRTTKDDQSAYDDDDIEADGTQAPPSSDAQLTQRKSIVSV